MLVKAEVEYRTEDYKNALTTMESTFELVAGKGAKKGRMTKSKIMTFTEKDR